MIIWLASFPRSANTMIRILLNQAYGRLSYSLYEEHPWEGGQENIASVMGSAGQVIKARFGDRLVATGYEKDLHW